MGVLLVTVVASMAALGAFLPGYNIGSANGLQNYLGFLEYFGLVAENFDLLGNGSSNGCATASQLGEQTKLILGAIVSVVMLGTAVGNVIGGKLSDVLGRKRALLLSGVFFVLGAAVQGTALQGAIWMLILGRIIVGLGIGMFFLAGPVYISEISPPHIRGRLSSLIGPFLAMGLILGYVANIGLSQVDAGWRASTLLTTLFGCVYIVGVAFIPSSPRWLMLRGKESKAKEALKRLSVSTDSIDSQIEDIKMSLPSSKDSNCLEDLKLFRHWKNIKRLLLGILIQVLQFVTGNHIYFYSETLFCSFGVAPFVTSILVGVMSFVGALIATLLIDKLGRKVLLASGGVIMTVLVGVAGVLVDVFNLETEINSSVGVSYTVVVLISLFMLVYTATWFVVPITIVGEIFPLKGRALAVGICFTCNGLVAYVVNQVFPFLLSSLQAHGFLYLLASVDLFSVLLVLLLYPETKGTGLEEIDALFAQSFLETTGLASCFKCVDLSPKEMNSASSVSSHASVQFEHHSSNAGSMGEGWTEYFRVYEQEMSTMRSTTQEQTRRESTV